MKVKKHLKNPTELLELYSNLVGRGGVFEFAHYLYKPQKLDNWRKITKVKGPKISGWAATGLKNLQGKQELAVQSRVWIGKKIHHIPMLDLMRKPTKADIRVLRELFRALGVRRCYLFSSGRGSHLYGYPFLPDKAFVQFQARALLANLPAEKPLVDTRWIAHRLLCGYGALRLSKNSNIYLQAPEYLGEFSV